MAEAPKKGRLTLYEELLSEETLAERKAKEAATLAEEAKKKKDASLMFKPTNLGKKSNSGNKTANKPKPTFASMHKTSSSTSTTISAPPTVTASSPEVQQSTSAPQQPVQAPPSQQASQKRGFSDWLANEDEEWMYENKPSNAGRNKKKKKNNQVQEEWSWEDIYDPHTPVNFLEYPKSEVQYDINETWKQRLYDAQRRERHRQGKDGKREKQPPTNMHFAPPGAMSFAPPSDFDTRPPQHDSNAGLEKQEVPRRSTSLANPYATPTAMSSKLPPHASPAPSLPGLGAMAPQPSSSASSNNGAADKAAKIAAQIAAVKAKALAAKAGSAPSPSVPPSMLQLISSTSVDEDQRPPPLTKDSQPAALQPGTISAAPTFNPEYSTWKARQEAGENVAGENVAETSASAEDPDAPRSKRPGQSGFAERMLKRMGWEEGKGLGASGEGITTAIVAKADKRKKKSDAEGGGFVTPANMGKIVGGKKSKPANNNKPLEDSNDAFGPMSEVIKLSNILDNMNVEKEIQDNNILQEIGDEVGEFGTVERLFIWRDTVGGHNEVFVKFTSQLSALRAVRDMNGIEFAGNTVNARFWNAERFERGEYE